MSHGQCWRADRTRCLQRDKGIIRFLYPLRICDLSLLTLADGWELVVESSLKAGARGGSDEQMVGIAAVLDLGTHLVPIEGDHSGIGWLLWPAASLGLMLADEIEQCVAIGVAPEPTLRAIESCTIFIAARMIPEGDS